MKTSARPSIDYKLKIWKTDQIPPPQAVCFLRNNVSSIVWKSLSMKFKPDSPMTTPPLNKPRPSFNNSKRTNRKCRKSRKNLHDGSSTTRAVLKRTCRNDLNTLNDLPIRTARSATSVSCRRKHSKNTASGISIEYCGDTTRSKKRSRDFKESIKRHSNNTTASRDRRRR